MSKKVLILKGSPRHGGNSELLADALARGAAEAGHEVTEFAVARHKINGCLACDRCWSLGTPCIQKDDMAKLAPLMQSHDVVVFATPLYYYGISAQLKAVIDRMYPFGGSDPAHQLAIRESVLLVTCADKTDHALENLIDYYHVLAKFMKWQDRGVIGALGLWEKGAIEGHPELEQAYQLGKSL